MNREKFKVLSVVEMILCVILLLIAIYSYYVDSSRKDKIINTLQKEITSYEEKIDKIEEEVGIIEDLKYQIEGYDITLVRKMNELEELELQIAEKKTELESIN